MEEKNERIKEKIKLRTGGETNREDGKQGRKQKGMREREAQWTELGSERVKEESWARKRN